MPTATGANNNPDSCAENPNPTCNNNGIKNGTPPNAILSYQQLRFEMFLSETINEIILCAKNNLVLDVTITQEYKLAYSEQE